MNPKDFIIPDMPGYTLATINGVKVEGLFTRNYIETNRMSGNLPLLTVADSESINTGDAITIDSNTYTVEEIQNDGDGFFEVVLSDG